MGITRAAFRFLDGGGVGGEDGLLASPNVVGLFAESQLVQSQHGGVLRAVLVVLVLGARGFGEVVEKVAEETLAVLHVGHGAENVLVPDFVDHLGGHETDFGEFLVEVEVTLVFEDSVVSGLFVPLELVHDESLDEGEVQLDAVQSLVTSLGLSLDFNFNGGSSQCVGR